MARQLYAYGVCSRPLLSQSGPIISVWSSFDTFCSEMLVPQAGIEPATYRLEGGCSIR